uniref:Uncharacterized protein n=1 Tax=Oryza rufipogon TaxID=4529 RepID=A0A0E0P4I9_ORYRU
MGAAKPTKPLDTFRHTHTLRHSTNKRRKWGPRNQPSLWTPFATPTPFATIPVRYGAKGWGENKLSPEAKMGAAKLTKPLDSFRHNHTLYHSTNKVRHQGLGAKMS